MNHRRWTTGVCLLLLLGTVTAGLLAFATAWTPEASPPCFPTFLQSQFPKWLGCAMAVHETLAGSLVAASGALFAAWLAYAVVQDQIGVARQNEISAERLRQEKVLQDAASDLETMQRADAFIQGLLSTIPDFTDTRTAPGAVAETLLEIRRKGYLHIPFTVERTPDLYGENIKTAITRLATLAESLHEETKALSADQKVGVFRSRNPDAIQLVIALRGLGDFLRGLLPSYEKRLNEAKE
jgi:hypothetical protein